MDEWTIEKVFNGSEAKTKLLIKTTSKLVKFIHVRGTIVDAYPLLCSSKAQVNLSQP